MAKGEGKLIIYTGDLRKIGGLFPTSKVKPKPLTKKQKTISKYTFGGLATGVGLGSLFGGFGLMAGVPLGTYAGNLLGKYKTRKKR